MSAPPHIDEGTYTDEEECEGIDHPGLEPTMMINRNTDKDRREGGVGYNVVRERAMERRMRDGEKKKKKLIVGYANDGEGELLEG